MAERMMAHQTEKEQEVETLIELLRQRVAAFGRAYVARELNVDPSYLGRVLVGTAKVSSALVAAVKAQEPIP